MLSICLTSKISSTVVSGFLIFPFHKKKISQDVEVHINEMHGLEMFLSIVNAKYENNKPKNRL